MKYNLIKFKAFFAVSCLLIMVTSCVKERDGFTDLSQTSDLVILNGAGTSNFKAANILVNTSSADTIKKTVMAVLASNNSNNSSVTVTIAVDNASIAAYNAANGTNFQAFPANAFKLVSNTITIKGGLEHTGATTLWVFQDKLDPVISYMLPIKITDGGGKALSSNQNIIYYNVIGNPIAGDYELYASRWLAADSTGGAGSADFYEEDEGVYSFSAASPTQIQVDGAFGETIIIDFTNTNGVLSNFKVSNPAGTAAALGVPSWGPPVFEAADPIHGYYKIFQQYKNASGLTRTVVYQYIKL